jgi:hypothetical protein
MMMTMTDGHRDRHRDRLSVHSGTQDKAHRGTAARLPVAGTAAAGASVPALLGPAGAGH